MDDQSFLLTLRNAAKACPDAGLRELARGIADQLAYAIDMLYLKPSPEHMRRVNGLWSLADRALGFLTTAGDDNSRGGAMPVPAERDRLAA